MLILSTIASAGFKSAEKMLGSADGDRL